MSSDVPVSSFEESSVEPSMGLMYLMGPVSCESVSPLLQYLRYINNVKRRPRRLQLIVNSDGGSFEDGFALVDAIMASRVPVDSFCLGRACSVALPIYLAGRERLVGPHSYSMFHGVSVEGIGGIADTIKKAANEAAHSNRMMVEFICSRTAMSPAVLRRVVASGQDLYLYPEEMLKKGLATGYLC